MIRSNVLITICALLLPGLSCGQVQEGSIHRVVRLSGDEARQPSEVSVAINPADPENIVGVSLQFGGPGEPAVSNVAYVTTDGGVNWRTVASHNPEGRMQADDIVTFDATGRAYHAYISYDGIRQERPPVARNGIFVQASSTGGETWEAPVAVVDHLNTVEPFEDKPALVADNVADSPHRGNLYIAWARFDVYGSGDPADSTQIYFSHSDDGGTTFAMPVRVSDAGGDALDGDGSVMGAVPAVGPGGEVYLVWAGPRGLVFDRSMDGGWTFGADRVIAQTPGGWDIEIPGLGRSNGLPVVAVDLSEGPHGGTLYVNWIDERNGDPDVFLLYSRDGGSTWSEPVRVNDDPVGNGKAQFFTWMAVDPVDGSVNVVFHDRRAYSGTTTGISMARSVDGGQTFVNYPVEQAPFETRPDVFFGDYNGIAAFGGRVVAVYPHFGAGDALAVSAALFRFVPGTQSAYLNE